MELLTHWRGLADQGLPILQKYKILYLALEMRVGKTPTSLTIAHEYGAKNILFVTPKKAIEGIEDFHTALGQSCHVEVTNYEQLHNYEGDPDLVIIDEAHKLGAFPKPSQRTQNLKLICKGKPIIYLSGTPTPESFSQLFHQLWVSSFSPWYLFDGPTGFYKWARDYVTIRKKYISGHAINDYSKADIERIKKETDHLFVSFTQKEAGFKQEILEEVLLVRMQPATYNLAAKLMRDRIVNGKDGRVVLADTPVKLQNKIHQIFTGTVITESGDVAAVIFDKSKVSMIAEVFAGKKIAIFYKFRAEEIMIRAHLGRPITTDPKLFNKSGDVVFISQIQSGAEGVDLQSAEAIIFLNIDFSAKNYIQCRQRLQTKERVMPAKVYWVFAENGIEHKIFEAVKNKLDYTNAHFKRDFGIGTTKESQAKPGTPGLVGSENNNVFPARVA